MEKDGVKQRERVAIEVTMKGMLVAWAAANDVRFQYPAACPAVLNMIAKAVQSIAYELD